MTTPATPTMSPAESTHRRNKAVKVGLLSTLAAALAIPLAINLLTWAGGRALDSTSATYAKTVDLREHVANDDQRHFRDSITTAYRFQEISRRMNGTDSLLHCIRATQLHRPECE